MPYLEYPQLLGILLRMLSEGTPSVRREVMKVSAVPGPHSAGLWAWHVVLMHPLIVSTRKCLRCRIEHCSSLQRPCKPEACLSFLSQVLGIIGALDPHTHKVNLAELQGEGRLEREGVRPQFPNKQQPQELGEPPRCACCSCCGCG